MMMNRIILLGLFFCFSFHSYSQSFKGRLRYSIHYELDSVTIDKWGFSESIASKFYQPENYNNSVNFYFNQNSYARGGYKRENERFVYSSEDKLLYRFLVAAKKYQRVELIDVATRYGTVETTLGKRIIPKVSNSDSIRLINGIECSLLVLDFGKFGREEYWYNSDTLKVNVSTYSGHRFEYWDEILKVTTSFPIEMVKITDNYGRLKLTLSLVEEDNIDASMFRIPELRPLKDKKAAELMESLGMKYMEAKKG